MKEGWHISCKVESVTKEAEDKLHFLGRLWDTLLERVAAESDEGINE